jgi:hypothetical protein
MIMSSLAAEPTVAGCEMSRIGRRRRVFDYNPPETTDHEPGYRIEKHGFAPGE